MKKYLKSGFNTTQNIKLEAGTYSLVAYVKSLYGNTYTFALGYDGAQGVEWTEYGVDVVKNQLCKVWFTFTIREKITKLKPISNNFSASLPVYVADMQLTRGNVPVEAGASPLDFDEILDGLYDEIDLTKAIPYLAGEYKPNTDYIRTSNSYPIVSYGESGGAPLYYALIGGIGNNGRNKQPNLKVNEDTWENITSFKQVFTQVLFAEFAKLDSFVFHKGKMFSQEGTLRGVAGSNEYTDDDHEPNFEVDGISGKVKMKDADIEGTITGSVFTSNNGKVIVDGISNQIILKDADSDATRTILSPRKLPLTPSSYFGSSSTTDVPLGNLKRTYTQNSSSTVDLVAIPSGDSSAYQITIPQITLYVDVNHPGGVGGNEHVSLPNIAEIKVEIYKGGILQYNVSSVSAMSAGEPDSQTFTNELKSYTIQGSGTWSVRVTHVHTINKLPSNSEAKVTNINGDAIVAKVVNSSAIGSNGMIIATSGTEYTYMVGDTYEVRRGNVGFRITNDGVQKSTKMNLSNPMWEDI